MNNFYLFRFIYDKENTSGELYKRSATVIFCPGESIDTDNLQLEIKYFYERYHHTDEIVVIGGRDIEDQLKSAFGEKVEDVFKFLPKVEVDFFEHSLFIYTYDNNRTLLPLNGKEAFPDTHLELIMNEGLQNIFLIRGGLVESKGAHHFVFPSGKHCDKFLRTGNILLHSSEIYFIAFALLRAFNEERHNQIYCDTSSINTIAFALLDLKRRLSRKTDFKRVPVESFSSYNGLQESKGAYFAKSLILISASTSGNILDKIKKANPIAKKENMVILYFHGKRAAYLENQDNILCNLTKDDNNPNGIEFYDTFETYDCEYCQAGSYPVSVLGDVFLLEKPKINFIKIGVKDAPRELSNFVKEFITQNKQHLFKVSYKERVTDGSNMYELYFNMFQLLKQLPNKKATNFERKLNHFIDQYIPSNTKFVVYLNDQGSELLADIIISKIETNYREEYLPKKISQNELASIKDEEKGAVVIAASCISNGKNLLYISRSLRRCDNLRLIYFNALTRTQNEDQLEFLKSNLKQGSYGNDTNTFVSVYNFYMNNDSKNTTWVHEIEFLKMLKDFYDKRDYESKDVFDFMTHRMKFLADSMTDTEKGLAEGLFYNSVPHGKALELRKNFAFFNFSYNNDVSQADVYFTISSIINHLRNSKNLSKCLKQTEYVRNIIEPGNFNRFNDGIIQASILRAACKQELAYHLDYDLSKNMFDILYTLIKNYDQQQGEALHEFIYALAIQKMSLRQEHIENICSLVRGHVKDEVIKFLTLYIEETVLKKVS